MNVFCSGQWLNQWDTIVAANLLYSIHLFKNNHVPVYTDTVAQFTEADFSGYGGGINLTWGAAFVNGSNQGEIDAMPATWTRSAGATSNTVYGIYVLDQSGNLAYAERFSAPVSMSSNGDTVTYTPRATQFNQ